MSPTTDPPGCPRGHGPPGLVVEAAGLAVVQDLGRPGHGDQGIAVNGASDRWSAQVANTLVGNSPGAPLVEVTGSTLALRAGADTLVSVTGADTAPTVAGRPAPTWDPFVVQAGAAFVVPPPSAGLRSYVALAGGLRAPRVLGSVAPDPMLGVGRQLSSGDRLELAACLCGWRHPHFAHPLFRLHAPRPRWTSTPVIDVTAGPELEEFAAEDLRGPWTVGAQSDHVGLRAEGPTPVRSSHAEILSRGVPVGAVEVPPGGGLLVLLHGRLVTAGYPVPYVATSLALDVLGQARPGDRLELREVPLEDAVARARSRRQELLALAGRVATALRSSGLGDLVAPGHLGQVVGGSSPEGAQAGG